MCKFAERRYTLINQVGEESIALESTDGENLSIHIRTASRGVVNESSIVINKNIAERLRNVIDIFLREN